MKEWVPLFQQLVWPLFTAAILVWARRPLGRLLKTFEDRVASGAEFEAGASGIKVGAAPKLSEASLTPSAPKRASTEATGAVPKPSDVYLVHTVRRDSSLDHDDRRFFRIRIYLDADTPNLLDSVTLVTYYLHETFKNPVRLVSDRRTLFALQTIAWGEFNVLAVVHFKDGHEVTLERYLNL